MVILKYSQLYKRNTIRIHFKTVKKKKKILFKLFISLMQKIFHFKNSIKHLKSKKEKKKEIDWKRINVLQVINQK